MRKAWLTLLAAGVVLTSSGVWRLEAQGAALSPVPGLRLENKGQGRTMATH